MLLLETEPPLLEQDRADATARDLSLEVNEQNQFSCYYIREGVSRLASRKLLYGLRNIYPEMDKILML